MKNFFLAGLAPDQKAKLQEGSVPFCDFQIDGPGGVVIEETHIPRTLELLSAEISSESATTLEGIFVLVLRATTPAEPARSANTVSVESWDGEKEEKFMAVAQEVLLPVVKRDVQLSVPHKKTVAPASDGKFHVFFWSAPAGQTVGPKPPEKIWGIATACRDEAFLPSGQGVPIVDTQTGWVVAEMVGNNLYVHHDLCHYGKDSELQIFRRLCEEVVVELSLTPKEKSDRQRKLAEDRRLRSREAYVRECSQRFEKTVAGTTRAISDGEIKVKQLTESLVRAQRELYGSRRKLEQLSACKGGELDKYAKEFDKFLGVPKVRDVQAADGVVKVFTETLFCTDPRTKIRHDIGAFCIEIYTSGASNGVRWFNLTRRVDGYKSGMQAPHVFPEGNACFGNTAETFAELIGSYEFAAAAMVAIQFVESVNTDDPAGATIDRWPVAECVK